MGGCHWVPGNTCNFSEETAKRCLVEVQWLYSTFCVVITCEFTVELDNGKKTLLKLTFVKRLTRTTHGILQRKGF